MHRKRQAHNRPPPASRCELHAGLFRLAREVWTRCILFCGEPPRSEKGKARRDNHRAAGPLKRRTNCFDGTPIRLDRRSIIVEVVYECGVDNGIGRGRSAPKALKIFERAAMHLGSCPSERCCALIGAGETEHFITCLGKFLNDCGTYEACGTSYENTHVFLLRSCEFSR